MKREITAEARKSLLALLPVSKNGTPFVPDIYPKEHLDLAPTVYIRMLTIDEIKSRDAEMASQDIHDVIKKYAHLCTTNIKNLIDLETGEEIMFKNDIEYFNELPISLVYAIYKKVNEISSLIQNKELDEKESLG